MTALKREAIHLAEQMPYAIQYIHGFKSKNLREEQVLAGELPVTPKKATFLELEKMLVPIPQELNYDKELAEARDEKYGGTD